MTIFRLHVKSYIWKNVFVLQLELVHVYQLIIIRPDHVEIHDLWYQFYNIEVYIVHVS